MTDHGEFVCGMCQQTFEKARPDTEAEHESEERFGAIPEGEQAIVCEDCMNWMVDVERICRELAMAAGDDPDELMTARDGPVPLWTAFMDVAKARTTLPAPPGV